MVTPFLCSKEAKKGSSARKKHGAIGLKLDMHTQIDSG